MGDNMELTSDLFFWVLVMAAIVLGFRMMGEWFWLQLKLSLLFLMVIIFIGLKRRR